MSDADKPLIKLDGVKKVFFTDEVETHALAGIHLESSGASTSPSPGRRAAASRRCCRSSGLLDTPSDGKYLLNGRPVETAVAVRARPHPQPRDRVHLPEFNLIGDLTVYENVELPLTYRGMKAAERKTRCNAALERVGMAHRAKHLPSQLSGGQQQRVAVARAVVGEPLDPAGGRADRQPRLEERRGGHGAAARAAPRRRHHLHGDARPALCARTPSAASTSSTAASSRRDVEAASRRALGTLAASYR